MMKARFGSMFVALIAAALFLGSEKKASAEPTTTTTTGAATCSSPIERSSVVPCALRASLAIHAERRQKDALEGRLQAVSPLLPSNPVLSFSAGQRGASGTQGSATNWYVTLAQELEVAGQRGTRRRAVGFELEAQDKRIRLTEMDVAADALEAFFMTLAADEEARVVKTLETSTRAMATTARAMADRGLVPTVEADVAEAALLRVVQARFAADRHVQQAQADLAMLIGIDPAIGVAAAGTLDPLADVETTGRAVLNNTATDRLDVRALDDERRALSARADALRRARLPNPSLVAFAQNDGFNERVFGGGISIPIPLPAPVGRVFTGEIAEAEAAAARTAAKRDGLRREARRDLAVALKAYALRVEELATFGADRISRADASLRAIAREIEAGRLAVRDGLITQQALVELLRAHVEARRSVALASVAVARAAGVPLDQFAR